jgi:CcmD family protein
MLLLLAQVTAEDLAVEKLHLQHDYQFLTYGLVAAWVILAAYVIMMVGREKKLKREIANLRAMLEDRR